MQDNQSIDPNTTPSAILGNLIHRIQLVDRTSGNGTTYDAFVAALQEGIYTSEAALITLAGTLSTKLVKVGHSTPKATLLA